MDVFYWCGVWGALVYCYAYARSTPDFLKGCAAVAAVGVGPALFGYFCASVALAAVYAVRSGAGARAHRSRGIFARVWYVLHGATVRHRGGIVAALDLAWCVVAALAIVGDSASAYPRGHAKNSAAGNAVAVAFAYGAACAYRAAECMFG